MIRVNDPFQAEQDNLDFSDHTVSPLGRRLLAWIMEHGPVPIRPLTKQPGFNYYTIKPDLEELVSNGFLMKDDKPSAKPGNPVYYHMTHKGAQIIVENWNAMNVLERSDATCKDNYSDLGIISTLIEVVRDSTEPGKLISYLWLVLFLGGVALLTLGHLIGIAPLIIDAALWYEDYGRKRKGLGRPMSIAPIRRG